MKLLRIIQYAVYIACILLASPLLASRAYAIDGFVKVTYPTGGQTFTEGDKVTITWDSSSNIDKVAIMYKSDEHHGNWVAFSTENTHSYTWNVDVGNTTNTQFYIEITGYETGKGSTTNFGGYFTVNQKADSPPTPTSGTTQQNSASTPTSSQTSSRTTTSNSNYVPFRQYPTLTPTPTPRPLSVYTVWWSEKFWFEGSKTTNLSTIKDPAHVDNLTIDTKYGWTYSFTESLDLTDPKKLSMLKNIDSYWSVEWWYIWIKVEWWEVFKKPAEFTYKNENLTDFAPAFVAVQSEETKTKDNTEKPSISIKSTKPGEVKAAINGAGKIEVQPRVEIVNKKNLVTSSETYTMRMRSSHKNLAYELKVNGTKQKIEPTNFNTNTGEFSLPVTHLTNGSNFVQVNFLSPGASTDSAYILGDEAVIMRKFDWIRYGTYALCILVGLGTVAVVIYYREHLMTPITHGVAYLHKRLPKASKKSKTPIKPHRHTKKK